MGYSFLTTAMFFYSQEISWNSLKSESNLLTLILGIFLVPRRKGWDV